MQGYDVAIVGAGVHGAAAALHLAERGARVVVLEKETPASGPTGRSSAVLRGYYVNEFLAHATRSSLDLFRNFTEWTHGGEARYVGCGALFLHHGDDEPKLREAAARLNAIGTVTEVLDSDRLRSEFPMIDLDGIDVGAWEPHAGHADPSGTTYGMLNRAVALGAELRRHNKVVKLADTPNAVEITTEAGDVVAADRVLLAAGPWSSQLLSLLGCDLPLWAERHIIATYGWGAAPEVPFVWASIPDGIYFKPELHAQFLVGTLWEEPRVSPDDYEPELDPSEQLRITEATVRRIPSLADAEAFSGYAALYDVSPDWQPVIGEVVPNVYIVAGTAGHGFKWAPAMGGHIADLVLGGEIHPGLAQFDPHRFDRGEVVDAGYGAAKILG